MEPFLRKQGMPVRLNKGTNLLLLCCFCCLLIDDCKIILVCPICLSICKNLWFIYLCRTVSRCCGACFWLCCMWRREAIVTGGSSHTGLYIFPSIKFLRIVPFCLFRVSYWRCLIKVQKDQNSICWNSWEMKAIALLLCSVCLVSRWLLSGSI